MTDYKEHLMKRVIWIYPDDTVIENARWLEDEKRYERHPEVLTRVSANVTETNKKAFIIFESKRMINNTQNISQKETVFIPASVTFSMKERLLSLFPYTEGVNYTIYVEGEEGIVDWYDGDNQLENYNGMLEKIEARLERGR